jgi:hypothetical protein
MGQVWTDQADGTGHMFAVRRTRNGKTEFWDGQTNMPPDWRNVVGVWFFRTD